MKHASPEAVVAKLIELMGGRAKAFAAFHEGFARINSTWAQDTERIGRILRSHLFVEHFLTDYVVSMAPDLDIEGAQLSFAKKLALLGEGCAGVRHLIPGIKRVNVIRNRLAHTLKADVTQKDVDVFLGIGLFRAMREESARHDGRSLSEDPTVIVEEFSLHVGCALQSHADGSANVWGRAYDQAMEDVADCRDHGAT